MELIAVHQLALYIRIPDITRTFLGIMSYRNILFRTLEVLVNELIEENIQYPPRYNDMPIYSTNYHNLSCLRHTGSLDLVLPVCRSFRVHVIFKPEKFNRVLLHPSTYNSVHSYHIATISVVDIQVYPSVSICLLVRAEVVTCVLKSSAII